MKNHSLKNEILTVKEVAEYLGKSKSWVYKHQEKLGVRKLGGSLFFPKEGELYERLFCKEKQMEIRLQLQGKSVLKSMVSNESKSQTSRSKKKRGAKKSHTKDEAGADPNRHNLFDFGK